jgi:hypothetical protein
MVGAAAAKPGAGKWRRGSRGRGKAAAEISDGHGSDSGAWSETDHGR